MRTLYSHTSLLPYPPKPILLYPTIPLFPYPIILCSHVPEALAPISHNPLLPYPTVPCSHIPQFLFIILYLQTLFLQSHLTCTSCSGRTFPSLSQIIWGFGRPEARHRKRSGEPRGRTYVRRVIWSGRENWGASIIWKKYDWLYDWLKYGYMID